MTIRIRPSRLNKIDKDRINALITESLLSPTIDDAPEAAEPRPHGGWLRWSAGQGSSGPQND